MNNYRVTIKYQAGENAATISKTVPAYNERQAIEKVIAADKIVEVVSKKAELIKLV